MSKQHNVCLDAQPTHYITISNNVVCATSKASDQPAHTHKQWARAPNEIILTIRRPLAREANQ